MDSGRRPLPIPQIKIDVTPRKYIELARSAIRGEARASHHPSVSPVPSDGGCGRHCRLRRHQSRLTHGRRWRRGGAPLSLGRCCHRRRSRPRGDCPHGNPARRAPWRRARGRPERHTADTATVVWPAVRRGAPPFPLDWAAHSDTGTS